jgi:hypothetical protein
MKSIIIVINIHHVIPEGLVASNKPKPILTFLSNFTL